MRCPTTVKLVEPVDGPFVKDTPLTTGKSYVVCLVNIVVFVILLLTIVTVIPLFAKYFVPTDLHVTAVADFHSDCSHPVCPIRTDGDFPPSKFNPSTMIKEDPAKKSLSHAGISVLATGR